MRDAMPPDRARDVLIGMQGEAMAFAASELPRSAQRQKDAAQDAIAALALALAALDAVARVRTLAPLLYAERVRLIADEYAGVLSTGAVVTLHDVATRLADIGRALDGEADR